MSTRNRLVVVGLKYVNDEESARALLEVLNERRYRSVCGSCGTPYVVHWESAYVVDAGNYVAFAACRCDCGALVTNLAGSGPVADEAVSAAKSGELTDGEQPVAAAYGAMLPQ